MRARINTEILTRTLLQKHGAKVKDSAKQTLQEQYCVHPRSEELFIMPSFNDFLGGRPVNEARPKKDLGTETLIGPVLRSESIDIGNSELYLLDGTYLGTLNQLRTI